MVAEPVDTRAGRQQGAGGAHRLGRDHAAQYCAADARLSGQDRQRDEARRDRQVHAGLEQRGPPGGDRQHRHHDGERGQQDPGGLEAEEQLPVDTSDTIAIAGIVRPMLAIAEP